MEGGRGRYSIPHKAGCAWLNGGLLSSTNRWPLAVTLSHRKDPALEARARAAADDAGVPFIPRDEQVTLAQMLATQAEALVIFEAESVRLLDSLGSLCFSPGMAHLRVMQLDRGVHEDMLLRTGGISPGERVLDCTLGLAGDAQVAARLVGPAGCVVALEKSVALYLVVRHGLVGLPSHPLSGPIQVHCADAASFLAKQPAGAFDIILFDPMFARTRKSSAAFDTLRRHADYSPLTERMVADAQRVARRAVVIKGSRYSSDFKKLDIKPQTPRHNATILWAVLPGLG